MTNIVMSSDFFFLCGFEPEDWDASVVSGSA
jgi:hypothetical protein